MLTHYFFEKTALVLIATTINTIGVKKKDVSCIHQSELGQVRRFHSSFPIIQREIAVAIGVVFRNLQAEGKKLHHAAPVQLHELREFCGVDQRWRMTEVHKSKPTGGADLAVQHCGDLLDSVGHGPP